MRREYSETDEINTMKYGSSEQEICGKFGKKSAEITMKRCQSPLDP